MAKMKKDIVKEEGKKQTSLPAAKNFDLSEELAHLNYRYRKLCEAILPVFKSEKTYQNESRVLSEIEALPMAYLRSRYPMYKYLEWEGMFCPNRETSPELFDNYLEYSDAHPHDFVRLDEYNHALDELSGSIKQQDAETIAELEAYLAHYAQHKGFDMWALDRILEEHLAKDERLQWLEGVRDRCMQDKGTMYDYGGIYEPPLYLKYRDLWVFELSKQYLITKDTDRLDEMAYQIWKEESGCLLKEPPKELRVLPKSAIKLFITRDEKFHVVVKIDIKLELEGHEAYRATVMELREKESGRVAKRNKAGKKSLSDMEIRYPGIDKPPRKLSLKELKDFYYIIKYVFKLPGVADSNSIDEASIERINSFISMVLPVDNPKETCYLRWDEPGKNYVIDPELETEVSNKSGTVYT
jgi:hypothetical protein